jgi:hypothetical protein
MELVVHAIVRFAVASAPQRPPTAGGRVTLARYILQGASVRYVGFFFNYIISHSADVHYYHTLGACWSYYRTELYWLPASKARWLI